MRTIGVTARAAFRRCKLAWKWQYVDRLELIDKSNLASTVGIAVHEALAKYMTDKLGAPNDDIYTPEYFDALAEEMGKKYDSLLTMDKLIEAKTLITNYGMYRQDRRWVVRAVEKQLQAAIPKTRVRLTGRIDGLVIYDGQWWIVDHKTVRSYATPFKLDTDDQVTAYVWLARQAKINVQGVIYNEIGKRKYPPLVNVSYVTRTSRQLEYFEECLIEEARDMTSKNTRVYPSFGEHCGWCQMRSLCLCRADKGNVDLLKEHYYQVKEKNDGFATPVEED
jgi:CRISPR/Cas system-associated exonuclease Cas4 (RecB family)